MTDLFQTVIFLAACLVCYGLIQYGSIFFRVGISMIGGAVIASIILPLMESLIVALKNPVVAIGLGVTALGVIAGIVYRRWEMSRGGN